MYSFIPSWYGNAGSWDRDAGVWYKAGGQMEFDDAVNQIKMFQMAGEDVEIILPGCIPFLRHFLHREQVGEAEVWSVFDQIQNIKGNTARQIHLNEYSWPEDIEWSYTPFLMIAYKNGALYAKAEFNEEGWWVEAVFYENNAPVRRIHLDDRGFISYAENYRNGEPEWRFYYDRKGRWQIKEDIKRSNVYVNPVFSNRFERASYANLGQLIEEVLLKHLRERTENSLIIAFDERHNEIIQKALQDTEKKRKAAYSVFSQRTGNLLPASLESMIRENRLIVSDTEYLADQIRNQFPQYSENVMDLSPYDARLALGKSSTISALKILYYVNRDTFDNYENDLINIFHYMEKERKAFLTIGIGRHIEGAYAVNTMKMQLTAFMESIGIAYRFDDEKENIAENEAEEEDEPRIAVRECRSETQIIEVLSDHRIIFDSGSVPDLYLQIAGISAGLPIILRTKSQYVSHKENGWILERDDELERALDYYLSSLTNWNKSLIWSLRRIGEYANGNIVERWKKAMDRLTGNMESPTGNTDGLTSNKSNGMEDLANGSD